MTVGALKGYSAVKTRRSLKVRPSYAVPVLPFTVATHSNSLSPSGKADTSFEPDVFKRGVEAEDDGAGHKVVA